ncbi:MAG: hypothetical protein R3C71_09220 [Candidatus Krumholzibacteriia bacterium]|nr:hypothetical protein [Candidatus Latescibacterota bacterium]MCB9516772.1 hypothetical protein [Candidatus Latescibacterota bacterium]
MRRSTLCAALLAGLLVMGCDSGGGPSGPVGPGNTGGNSFTAKIDGGSWASRSQTISISGNPSDPVTSPLTISGIDATGRGVQLYLGFISGEGVYPLGVNFVTNAGGTAQVVVPPQGWLTPFSGSAGMVDITTRTATRIAGNFAFVADEVLGGTPLHRSVTEGAFDITVAAGLPPLPTGTPSALGASLDGTPWNAATVVTASGGGASFSVSASSTEWQLTAVPQVPVSAGNSYAVPSEVSISVIRVGTSDAWTAIGGPDVGSWSIDAFSATGMTGSFSATLPKSGGGAALTLGGGAFDVTFFTP